MALRRGVLDRKYIFEYDVGQWTFGTIQVLKEKGSGDLRTCKVVPKFLLKNPSNVLPRLKALQEQLQHPHICSITDVLEDKENFFIIFEFLQGGDMQDWMERLDEANWLQEQTCAAYIRQAILALVHSHAAQVYHRDLRPSNFSLTTKLPDAVVKLSDCGLSAIFDADNGIIQKNPTPYSEPEVLKTSEQVRTSAPDMWSIGAIAHALLVGHAPAECSSGTDTGWSLARRVRGVDDDGWQERSAVSRDFVQRLLRPAADRPTAAKALSHPWLKGLSPLKTVGLAGDSEVARELRHKTLCYMLGVILLPVVVPYRDFEQLRVAFQQSDPDRDGFVPRGMAQRLLLGRCNLSEAVTPALTIVDVLKTDALDLCALACADLIVREFFAVGPTSNPLVGPFRATDLAPRMLKRFFEVFADKRSASQGAVAISTVRSKLRTATARDIEMHAAVRYEELLASLPEDRAFDSQALATQLTAAAGRGTPLASSSDLSPLRNEAPWSLGASAFDAFGLDVIRIFQSCGSGWGFQRDDSQHSIRIF